MIRAATVAALALAPTAPAMAEPDALYKDMTTFNDVVRNGVPAMWTDSRITSTGANCSFTSSS
jgi:hypothetical protein